MDTRLSPSAEKVDHPDRLADNFPRGLADSISLFNGPHDPREEAAFHRISSSATWRSLCKFTIEISLRFISMIPSSRNWSSLIVTVSR